MRHHLYNSDFSFVVEPENFDKYTERELLQYCLGATMYMPGTKDFAPKILSGAMPGLTTIVLCFEDACPEERVPEAEENVHKLLDTVTSAVENGALSPQRVPLIFVRVRNLEQFKHFGENLTKHQVKSLCGINFPKFNAENGYEYYAYLKDLNERFGEILYGMPIIEDPEVAYKETRMQELVGIKKILDKYHDLVLQVRVGGTDFSSVFGVRRGVDYSIYDIMTVRECLSDIINVCGRNNDYVISGPVWEYFRAPKRLMFEELPKHNFEDYLMKRLPIVNNEVDGLLREVILDKANGFVGRTVIHPTHIKFVNALMAVTKEEYDDACMILGNQQGGVVKGSGLNKMNEIKPHTNWATKIYMRARAYGVIENEAAYIKLFAVNE
ncbi:MULTISPECIES: HpcH/HpaI aldolase/citrate lyase family protein [unclassified Ruminococcus]|uniref:HpcH/HpaI aldolase/citrate lyase family protein n=1 Tax=unclassified Ruminococcus TaxID=2608920 RepID=UPI002109E805|nr:MULTISPECIES: HpcH/HpaI aldolase/citrate lyase family protein [unclassified Ruminococcus]MCQ4022551.1 ATP/GTP-binding protein [Ruminococcus sp. zg-924]MCQ4114791.1 ATP/GTP-binding protein [Ruminococcus sp. zg-921]